MHFCRWTEHYQSAHVKSSTSNIILIGQRSRSHLFVSKNFETLLVSGSLDFNRFRLSEYASRGCCWWPQTLALFLIHVDTQHINNFSFWKGSPEHSDKHETTLDMININIVSDHFCSDPLAVGMVDPCQHHIFCLPHEMTLHVLGLTIVPVTVYITYLN